MPNERPLWEITGENGPLRWYMSPDRDSIEALCERHGEAAVTGGSMPLAGLPGVGPSGGCAHCIRERFIANETKRWGEEDKVMRETTELFRSIRKELHAQEEVHEPRRDEPGYA